MMGSCAALHRQYDAIANGPVQVGELPDWMNLRGRVIWYVYAGPYKDISEEGWGVFMQKVMSSDMKPRGTPGDVYVCDPEDRKSTRLNSSHGYISYAAFCLKKI